MSEPVTFKGNKDGIVMLLDTKMEFEELCQLIVQKLWESRNFLGGQTYKEIDKELLEKVKTIINKLNII